MFSCQEGYIFESRIDMNSVQGVIETYKKSGNTVKVICGIDSLGRITPLYYFDKDTGFTELSCICDTDEGMDKFLRSNRGVYTKMGVANFFVEYKVTNNSASVELYIPKRDVQIKDESADCNKDIKYHKMRPAIACEKISVRQGINLATVNQVTYDKLVKGVINCFNKLDLSNKKAYYKSRLSLRG